MKVIRPGENVCIATGRQPVDAANNMGRYNNNNNTEFLSAPYISPLWPFRGVLQSKTFTHN